MNRQLITMLAMMVFILFISVSCDITGDVVESSGNEGLVIQGTLSTDSTSSKTASFQTRSTDTIESVLLLYGNTYVKEEVRDNSFSLPANELLPAGLILVGADNSFEGYVNFRENMNSMPLQAVDKTDQIIDLGQLVLNNTENLEYTPEHEPMDHMSTTTNEFESIYTLGSLFSSLISNPDFDSNGKVDVLENKRIRVGALYYFNNVTEHDAENQTFDIVGNISIKSHKFLISLEYPEVFGETDVTLGYPDGSTHNPTSASDNGFFFPGVDGLPSAGQYTFSVGTTDIDYSFGLPSTYNSLVQDNIVIIVPTYELNSDNTLHSVSWDTYLPDKSPIDNPEVIIDTLEVQIDVFNTVDENADNPNRIYDSGLLPVQQTEHELENQEIATGDISRLSFAYDDHYGNHYVIHYTP